MATTITVRDETMGGASSAPFSLDFLTDEITVRELIRERVYQEVSDYNSSDSEVFQGLVQPLLFQRASSEVRSRKATIDWRPQFDKACEAFDNNGVLILVDDSQMEALDQKVTISPRTEVVFLKLIPLVGG